MTDPDAPGDRDPVRPGPAVLNEVNQAAERTHLSWRRTILSALTVVLLAISKVVVTAPTPAAVLLVGLMVLSWLAIASIARRRMTALEAGHQAPINTSPALLALLVTVYAVLAAALIL